MGPLCRHARCMRSHERGPSGAYSTVRVPLLASVWQHNSFLPCQHTGDQEGNVYCGSS